MLLSIIYANDLSSTTTIHDSDFTCTQHTSQMFSYCWIYVKNLFNNNECIKESKATLHSCDQEVGRWCCGRGEARGEQAPPPDAQASAKNTEEKKDPHLKNAQGILAFMVKPASME